MERGKNIYFYFYPLQILVFWRSCCSHCGDPIGGGSCSCSRSSPIDGACTTYTTAFATRRMFISLGSLSTLRGRNSSPFCPPKMCQFTGLPSAYLVITFGWWEENGMEKLALFAFPTSIFPRWCRKLNIYDILAGEHRHIFCRSPGVLKNLWADAAVDVSTNKILFLLLGLWLPSS